MPGPAPKADGERRRRNPTIALTRLPAEGRRKRAPNWPLIPDVVLTAKRDVAEQRVSQLREQLANLEEMGLPTGVIENRLTRAMEAALIANRQLAAQRKLEAEVWRHLWSTPQSVQWEQHNWTRDVAQYVRFHVLGELGDMDAAKEARQWSDRLGLTPMSLLRLRWEIASDEVAERRQSRETTTEAKPTARQRLRMVDGAG